MLRLRRAGLAAAAVLAVVAGGLPAHGQAGAGAAWRPNDDDALLFDVRLGQYRLGDGVRGYQTPEGVCVNLPDIVAALDVPITVDKTGNVAEGWAFEERNRIRIDRTAG